MLATQRPPIAFALDYATTQEAKAAARLLAPAVGMVKVGLELFVNAGPAIVTALHAETGLPVFLDLKLHDIPETVERAVAQAASLGASLLTVHASGGRAMLRRAVERASNGLQICAVTVLTSLDESDLADIGLAGPSAEAALRLAQMAYAEGVRCFVCSPAEVRAIRRALGDEATLITPGVRPATAANADQKRVATPERAIADGADWVVVGRPIRDALDPLATARAIGASITTSRIEGSRSS